MSSFFSGFDSERILTRQYLKLNAISFFSNNLIWFLLNSTEEDYVRDYVRLKGDFAFCVFKGKGIQANFSCLLQKFDLFQFIDKIKATSCNQNHFNFLLTRRLSKAGMTENSYVALLAQFLCTMLIFLDSGLYVPLPSNPTPMNAAPSIIS